ncbi:porin [Martelella limonii]|uniref:porin n=1 Tax=Martelella limonii TaxID=1647649 RepID=UPI0015808C1C|nr:porin [Martelella limonii]
MKIQLALLGSASMLVAAASAHAADPVMVIEPVTANYVEVCDAYGAGYFFIPGTETCLQIGGYVRWEGKYGGIQTGSALDADWDPYVKALPQFTAKSDTELGTLTGLMAPEFYYYSNGGGDEFKFDQAYIEIGDTVALRAGYIKGFWNEDLWGELDNIDNVSRYNAVRLGYFPSDGFQLALEVDTLTKTGSETPKIGLSGRVAWAPSDSRYIKLDVAYDTDAETYAIRPWAGFAIGPGTFEIAGLYESGFISYAPDFTSANWNDSPIAGTYMKYAVAADYYFNVTDNFVLAPQTQYNVASNDKVFWEAGVTTDWEVVKNLHVRGNFNYAFLDDSWNQQNWFGWLRMERDF